VRETTTFVLVALPKIHRLNKIFTDRLFGMTLMYSDVDTVMCQVTRAFKAARELQVQLEYLDPRVFLATLAVLVLPVYQEVKGRGELQDFRVLKVLSAPRARQVAFIFVYSSSSLLLLPFNRAAEVAGRERAPLTSEVKSK